MNTNIFPAQIVKGTRFVVNGVTYTAEVSAPIGNGRKYHLTVRTPSGQRIAMILPASDTVASA
jgi:hypothetical protein